MIGGKDTAAFTSTEFAAIVDGDPPDLVIDTEVQRETGVGRAYIDAETPAELREIELRRAAYLRGRAPLPVTGCTVIVVDDGMATGTTMRGALQVLRRRAPAHSAGARWKREARAAASAASRRASFRPA